MIVKLLTEHHLEFLTLKGGYRGSSESTLVKMSNCWKSHAAAEMGTDISDRLYIFDILHTTCTKSNNSTVHTCSYRKMRENIV